MEKLQKRKKKKKKNRFWLILTSTNSILNSKRLRSVINDGEAEQTMLDDLLK